MEYTYDWPKAFELAKLDKRKLLDEHIEKAYYSKLIPGMTGKLGSKEDAFNICSLVIKKFWERFYIRGEALPKNVNGYLFTMANNAVIDYRKMKNKKREVELDLDLVTNRFQKYFVDQSISDDKVDHEEKENMYNALELAFGNLCSKCKTLLQYNIFEKKKIKTIYQELGFPTPNAATKKKISCINELKKLVYYEFNNQQNINSHV